MLDWAGWSAPCPGFLTLGKEPQYPLYRRLDGSQSQAGQVCSRENFLLPPRSEPQTVVVIPTVLF